MAAATIVYLLYIISGFSGPTTGGDLTLVASYPTKEACEAARDPLDSQIKQTEKSKIVICVSNTDLDEFVIKAASPYIK